MKVETEIYGNYRDMLLSVKPGLTGFWAANGRSCTSYVICMQKSNGDLLYQKPLCLL